MGYCVADDARACEDCGALIADGYWPEHTKFHERFAPTRAQVKEKLRQDAASLATMIKVLGFDGGSRSELPGEGLNDEERG